jgi:hypothetical protein
MLKVVLELEFHMIALIILMKHFIRMEVLEVMVEMVVLEE